jgi:hypothetical protein
MSKSTRWFAIAVVAAALVAFSAGVVGAKPSGRPDSGTLYSAITHISGKTEFIAGNATDKLLGPGAATYTATVGLGSKPGTYSVNAKVITFFKSGSLSGKATAMLTSNPDHTVTFTNGKIKLTNGAGAQKGHTFTATFTGTGTTLTGPYVFHYKGTYK